MNANLILFKKNGTTRAFLLHADVTVIGRRQECDLCVPLMVVSRRHCEINQDQGALRIRDLDSRNGTFVNGKKVTESVLNPGDKLRIGPVSFGVQINGEPAQMSAGDSDILTPPANVDTTPHDPLDFDELDGGANAGGDEVIDVFDSLSEDIDRELAAD